MSIQRNKRSTTKNGRRKNITHTCQYTPLTFNPFALLASNKFSGWKSKYKGQMNFVCLHPGVSKKRKIRELSQLTKKRTLFMQNCNHSPEWEAIGDKGRLQEDVFSLILRHFSYFHLEISVDHPIHVTVVDWLQDLLDAVTSICLRVELPGHNILKQLASSDPEKERTLDIFILILDSWGTSSGCAAMV